MQLDAFLGSLNLHASTVYTAISVLYTVTSDRHRSSYDVLIERFPKVAWVEESMFSDNLRDLVMR